MIDRHFHWEFIGWNGDAVTKEIPWPVTVEVVGYLSEADARIAVNDVVPRENFSLRRVWECQACGFQQGVSESMGKLSQHG